LLVGKEKIGSWLNGVESGDNRFGRFLDGLSNTAKRMQGQVIPFSKRNNNQNNKLVPGTHPKRNDIKYKFKYFVTITVWQMFQLNVQELLIESLQII
jgi:hypothetical protein